MFLYNDITLSWCLNQTNIYLSNFGFLHYLIFFHRERFVIAYQIDDLWKTCKFNNTGIQSKSSIVCHKHAWLSYWEGASLQCWESGPQFKLVSWIWSWGEIKSTIDFKVSAAVYSFTTSSSSSSLGDVAHGNRHSEIRPKWPCAFPLALCSLSRHHCR